MVTFPNCKINLGLHIIRKREDGYHDLETVFYPLPLRDALEVIADHSQLQLTSQDSPHQAADIQHSAFSIQNISFSSSGLAIDGDISGNLCVKAYHLLRADFPQLPTVHMHLHKTIPMGAGLGGGSADGAFTLTTLNTLFQLGLSTEQLIQYALQLGSDCPFFVINQPSYGTGRGEHLQPVPVDLSAYRFVVINPGIHVHTGKAFSLITPKQPALSVRDIVQQPVATWRDFLSNDFEAAVMQLHPEIAQLKTQLYEAGAVYASMSGSGSTVFGIFPKEQEPHLTIPLHYFFANLYQS